MRGRCSVGVYVACARADESMDVVVTRPELVRSRVGLGMIAVRAVVYVCCMPTCAPPPTPTAAALTSLVVLHHHYPPDAPGPDLRLAGLEEGVGFARGPVWLRECGGA
jgi:hypothetical protein